MRSTAALRARNVVWRRWRRARRLKRSVMRRRVLSSLGLKPSLGFEARHGLPAGGLRRCRRASVAHRAADAAGPADYLRIAARCSEDTEKQRVKHGNNLGQTRGDGDLPNAREQFAKREVDAVPAALRLTVRGDTTDPRSLPNRRAFDALALSSKNGNTSRTMFGTVVGSRRNDPQYSFECGSTEIRYSGFASSNASRSYPSFTVTSQPSRAEKTSARLRNIASISIGNDDERFPSITFNTVSSPFLLRDDRC